MKTIEYLAGVLTGIVVTICVIGAVICSPDRDGIFSEEDDED